jgi:hypothetical protein
MVQDKKAILVVPNKLKLKNDARYMKKSIYSKEEFLEMAKMVDREMKKLRKVT